jgi:heme exporter protein A
VTPPSRLTVSGLAKRFGRVRALRGLDLRVEAGEVVAILGPNGAGKSTLLRIVAGLMRPSAGTVLVDGQPLGRDPAAVRRRIGLVSHHTMLYDCLTARENLAFAARMFDVAAAFTRLDQLLRALEIDSRADEPVANLSRGMQQRVAIARALLHDPDLLLLDEPHAGLDETASRALAELLGAGERRGRSVLLVTHDLGRGLALAHRAVVLLAGVAALDVRLSEADRQAFPDTYVQCLREARAAAVGVGT